MSLRKISEVMNEIVGFMPEIYNISGEYFAGVFRKYLMGLRNVVYEGANYTLRSSPGGSTGNDPSYKVLSEFLGLGTNYADGRNPEFGEYAE